MAATELDGYENDAALPWYRIIECRQRGLFQHAINGCQQTCQINEQTLSQRDLAQIRFIFLRGPLIAYLIAMRWYWSVGPRSCWRSIEVF